MAPAAVKVLFLAGKGRSGGTLLAGLLGQLPGFFSVGELNRLWDWGLDHNYRCGCGSPVQECEAWRKVLAEADRVVEHPPGAPLAAARIDRAQAAVVRWPNLPRLLRARAAARGRWPDLERYTNASAAVYRALAEVAGARVVVDSSRLPFEPVALGLVPHADVRVVQLVRDPRAVVYSWKRSKAMTDRDADEYMPRYGAAFSTTSWTARNMVVELVRRRSGGITVHYDALARDPAGVLHNLAAFVDEPAGDLEFLASGTATLAPTHSVGGNPVRMQSGAIAITPDEEWKHEMRTRDRIVSTALALPLLHRYGFPVRP
jgi:hypothetical protein